MADNGWRTETNAQDYFGNQQKKLAVADRRPVIRKASDLVGPGINANAVRLTDFNNLLATYDGFFSADEFATNGPAISEAFVGTVVSDTDLGGIQTFTGLTSGDAYQRVFLRNPGDAATIYWGSWEFIGSGTGGGGTFLETLPASIIDAKGDLIVGIADNDPVRMGVGADGTSLVADSTAIAGVAWGTRVESVVAGDYITVDDTDPLNPIVNAVGLEGKWKWDDRHTISVAGDQSAHLTYIPVDQTLHVRWHPADGGAIPMINEDFTVVGHTVTIPDPGYFSVGDTFSFQYEYHEPEPGSFEYVGSASGVFHSIDNTMTFTPPADMLPDDLLVIAVRGSVGVGGGDLTLGATSGDSRISVLYSATPPVVEVVLSGFATSSTSDVVVNIVPNPSYLPSAIGVMAVFRGVTAIDDISATETGTTTPELLCNGAVAVTWDGNASFLLVSSSPPSGYTNTISTGLGYSSTDLSYWIDPVVGSSPAGTFAGEGCLVFSLV